MNGGSLQSGTIGLLLPTYNRLAFLKESLGSVLAQSYTDLTVIVIDNGSTDGTANYMASVNDSRVRYEVNEHNLGLIGSINRGIGLMPSAVSWCTVLCDDDLLDSNFIEALAATATAASAASIVRSHLVYVDGAGRYIRDAVPAPPEETALEYLRTRARSARETYLTGVLFRRSAFEAIGGYPAFTTGLVSDDALIFALSLRDRLVFDGQARAYIRLHEGAESLTSHDAIRKLKTIMEFREYCIRQVRERGEFSGGAELETVLMMYVRSLNGFWWLAGVHAAYDRQVSDNGQLTELIGFAQENTEFFSPRVRLGIACLRWTGILPERFLLYRSLWGIVKNVYRLAKP